MMWWIHDTAAQDSCGHCPALSQHSSSHDGHGLAKCLGSSRSTTMSCSSWSSATSMCGLASRCTAWTVHATCGLPMMLPRCHWILPGFANIMDHQQCEAYPLENGETSMTRKQHYVLACLLCAVCVHQTDSSKSLPPRRWRSSRCNVESQCDHLNHSGSIVLPRGSSELAVMAQMFTDHRGVCNLATPWHEVGRPSSRIIELLADRFPQQFVDQDLKLQITGFQAILDPEDSDLISMYLIR